MNLVNCNEMKFGRLLREVVFHKAFGEFALGQERQMASLSDNSNGKRLATCLKMRIDLKLKRLRVEIAKLPTQIRDEYRVLEHAIILQIVSPPREPDVMPRNHTA